MAQDQTIEIKVQLRDEISKAAEQAVAKLMRLNQVDTGRSQTAFNKLGQAASFAGREIRSLATITGIGGILGAGGIVAGLVAAKRSLDEFAQSGMRMHFTARELRVSETFLRDYTDALRAVGQSEGEAASGIQSALRTLEEAWTEGKGSRMFKELDKDLTGSGQKLFREVMATYGREGPDKALELALKRMEGMNPRAQAAFSKLMGFGSVGATELRKILPQLVPTIRMSKDEMLKYNIANVNLDRTWGNIKATIGTALLPAFTELTKAVDAYLRSPAGQKFLADIRGWITSMAESVRSEGFAKRMNDIIEGSEKLVTDLGAAFSAADAVVQAMGASWVGIFETLVATGIVRWLFGLGFVLRFIAPAAGIIAALTAFLHDPKSFREKWGEFMQKNRDSMEEELKRRGGKTTQPSDTFNMESPGFFLQILKDLFQGNLDLWGEKRKKTGALSPAGEEKSTIEKLAEAAAVRSTTGDLKDKLGKLDDELGQLTGYLMIGGPEGTVGSSGYQFGGGGATGDIDDLGWSYELGPAGGGKKNRPWPTLPSSATPLTAIPGTNRPAQTAGTGFASWYGNRPDLGFHDPEDRGRQGVREADQGIALGDKRTRGQYHYLTDPHTGLTHVVRQTDAGPNIRTQALLDIHASQLNRMGYTEKTFPNKRGLWKVQPTGFEKEQFLSPRGLSTTGGRSGAFDEGDTPLPGWETNRLNTNLSRAEGFKGSGEVDIDISNVASSRDASAPAGLFRPLILEKTSQMAAAGNDRSAPTSYNQA